MAALDFPSSPTNGQTYTANGNTWTYNSATSSWLATNTGSGPAFHAYGSTSTSVSINTYTKITFDAEVYDTANCFNTSNSRFTPNVAGYYQFTYNMITAQIIYTNFYPALYKNGSEHLRGPQINSVYGGGGAGLIYLNGTTDYVEVYLFQQYVDPATAGGNGSAAATQTYFTGFLARAA